MINKTKLSFLNEISPLYLSLFFVLIAVIMFFWDKKDNFDAIKSSNYHYLFQIIVALLTGIAFLIKWIVDL